MAISTIRNITSNPDIRIELALAGLWRALTKPIPVRSIER